MFEMLRARRRRDLRRPFRARCQAIRLDRFELVGERILDLSPDGALVACDREMRVGESVLLDFRMPWLGPTVTVEARVERIVEGWRTGDPGYCAGVRFVDLELEERHELRSRLAPFPGLRPSRQHPVDYAESVRCIALLPEGEPAGDWVVG